MATCTTREAWECISIPRVAQLIASIDCYASNGEVFRGFWQEQVAHACAKSWKKRSAKTGKVTWHLQQLCSNRFWVESGPAWLQSPLGSIWDVSKGAVHMIFQNLSKLYLMYQTMIQSSQAQILVGVHLHKCTELMQMLAVCRCVWWGQRHYCSGKYTWRKHVSPAKPRLFWSSDKSVLQSRQIA